MQRVPTLSWLPDRHNWGDVLSSVSQDPAEAWPVVVQLANAPLENFRTTQLDRVLRRGKWDSVAQTPRLAILSSCTVSHLAPAIRVGAVRRGFYIEIYEHAYGDYLREISDRSSGIYAFRPNHILLSFDARHLVQQIDAATSFSAATATLSAIADRLRNLWSRLRENFGCTIIQQTVIPSALPLLGENEHRLATSQERAVACLNHEMRRSAAADDIDLLTVDTHITRDGLSAWHDPVWWLRARHDVRAAAAPFYGDLVARLLAARRGLSRKCLVLDLDNTLWGGVVGDDGIGGIVLGPGNAEGEAFLRVQTYARDLSRRGVILAVVSKNDEAVASEVIRQHPEMILRENDFAVFIANWSDKASNIREVARRLRIGLDAIVFMDDNPFERELVRTELPEVAVPELPEDPALYPECIATAGYFEAIGLTDEDRARGAAYAASAAQHAEIASGTDLESYLEKLDMRLSYGAFDEANFLRIVQLINKTNQFNLTTPRLQGDEVRKLMADPKTVSAWFRLTDRLCDNGLIGLVVGSLAEDELRLDLWLMSCRVIGREVETAMMEVVVKLARQAGARKLVGLYRPSPKNGMVSELYPRLGFVFDKIDPDGIRVYRLSLDNHFPKAFPISISGG